MNTSLKRAFLALSLIILATIIILLPRSFNHSTPNNNNSESPPPPLQTSTNTSLVTSTITKPPKTSSITICTYYYVWYGSPDHPWTDVIDKPLLGYYNSSSLQIITQQLEWIKKAGIDCLIISWWGPGHYTDIVAQRVFQLLAQYDLKAVIMIEPWLGDEDPASNITVYNSTWWNTTLQYIKTHYIDQYNYSYLYLDSRPLIIAFNPIGMKYKPNTTIYTIRIVGNDIDNAHYQDWDYWPDYDINLTGQLRIRTDEYVAVTPRYDDEHFRPGNLLGYDPNLTMHWYQKQWNWIINNTDNISLIAIATWNEYHERTMIEPHYDATSPFDNPYYLYNITKEYISLIQQSQQT